MHERNKKLVLLAKQGNKDALSQIIIENKRVNMEYS